jgi:acyl-coenzyme A synthetase/AMP-(fatty) acid ligase
MQAESCPKGIVDLQHDMVYTAASYAAHVLGLRPDDICFVAAGASSVLFPGRPEPAAVRTRRHVGAGPFECPALLEQAGQDQRRCGDWIYTGDRFVRDRDGFFIPRSRLIKVSGRWVTGSNFALPTIRRYANAA